MGCIVLIAIFAGFWFVNLAIAGHTVAIIGVIVCGLVALAAAASE